MGILYITVFVFVTIIASFSLSQVYAEPIIYDDDYIVEKFATGLQYPTTMYFVGDDILVLEKNTGKVIRISDNGVLYNEPALDVPVIQAGRSGLLGIAFASNHIYLYFTESLSGFDLLARENSRNVVYQYDWDGEKLTNPILIKELPAIDDYHVGGVVTKGQNGEVYFAIGDQDQHGVFQNILGEMIYEISSIFKIDTERDNSVELFAIGLRNSFGLAVDPVTGYLWETENGPSKFDEINLVKSRFNSGSNRVFGPADRIDFDLSTLNPKPFENFVYSDPEFSWYVTVGPTAIAFPNPTSFERYSDWLFVGDYNNGRIYKFQLNADRTGFVFSNPDLLDLVLDDNDEIDEILFAKGFQGITDIKFHDSAMYVVVIGDGSIYKIYPKNILSPLKQYQNNVTHKKIVCKTELMPIMSKSGYIYCVYPKTAFTLINVNNWSIDHPEMPKIELKFQDLSGLNFEYSNLSNSDFRWSNFDTAMISNVNFSNANLSHTDLSGKDLTGTILTGADLTGTNLTNVNLSGKDLTGTILIGADLTGTILIGADLTNASLTNKTWLDKLASGITDFRAGITPDSVDLSGKDLTGTILTGADLTGTNLTNVNLSGKDLTGTILTGADLSYTSLPNDLSGHDFRSTKFYGTDLTGRNFSESDMSFAIFDNADLTEANFSGAVILDSDFTKIKNKSLAGANLSEASFAHSDLSGISLDGATLQATNLWKVNLSGVDFTNTDVITDALSFDSANLSNSNFEGINLSPKKFYSNVFKDKAYLINEGSLNEQLFGGFDVLVIIVSKEVNGNDLAVKFMFYNNFARANLENANFKNTELWYANFYLADLTNADLSGADLRNAYFGNADLSNANLSAANLQGAILDNAIFTGANLKCINHKICESD